MILARVVDEIVASQKVPSHEGGKLLLVQPLTPEGATQGTPLLALDAIGAGIGEHVLVVQDGYAAMTATGRPNSPIDCAVIAHVDAVALNGA